MARDLKRRKAREKHQLFVAEGVRAVEELLRSPLDVRGALIAPQLLESARGEPLVEALRAQRVDVQEVAPLEFGTAAQTESPQGVLAIAEVPTRSFAMLAPWTSGLILVLDAVQDPGNVGTIVRTAAALGAVATVALPGTVDLWNAKVVRSGMGAQFRHLAFSSTWDELDSFRKGAGSTLIVADAGGERLGVGDARNGKPVALVVGNEGAGVSEDARSRADRVISIPISPDVESLNVAVATGILLHTLRQ